MPEEIKKMNKSGRKQKETNEQMNNEIAKLVHMKDWQSVAMANYKMGFLIYKLMLRKEFHQIPARKESALSLFHAGKQGKNNLYYVYTLQTWTSCMYTSTVHT